ncbi:MAG TPA: hypothetical protein VGB55_06290 [Tepidisphaeraceae bacterium]|jgi:hypothetical protein
MADHTATTYTTGTSPNVTTGTMTPGSTVEYNYSERNTGHRLDLVRWPAVLAGLFGTLAILAVLTVLGSTIGLANADRNSEAENFGLGAGIWGIVSVLISFAFGGWLAARTAAVHGTRNAFLQGAVVWMVTIALLVYLIFGALGAAARTAGTVAQGVVSNPQVTGAAQNAATTNDPNAQAVQDAAKNVTAEDGERIADKAEKTGWGTLAAMVLSLAAAGGGAVAGAYKDDHDHSHGRHTGSHV